jgi:hypothetical protein
MDLFTSLTNPLTALSRDFPGKRLADGLGKPLVPCFRQRKFVVGLGLQETDRALGYIIVFGASGPEHIQFPAKELAPISTFGRFYDDKIKIVFPPEYRVAGSERYRCGIQPTFGIGHLQMDLFPVPLVDGRLYLPDLGVRKIRRFRCCTHFDPYRAAMRAL